MQLNSTCKPGNMFSKYFSKLVGDINDAEKKQKTSRLKGMIQSKLKCHTFTHPCVDRGCGDILT